MTMGEIAILRVINLSNNIYARKLVSKTSITVIIIFNIIVIQVWAACVSLFSLDLCDVVKLQSIKPRFSRAIEWCIFIPVIVACYTGIASYTKTRVGELAVQRNPRVVRYDIASIRTCIIIMVAFVICHLPFIVRVTMLHKYALSIDIVELSFYFQFNLFSQAGNPLIMFCTCMEFRKHVLMFVRFLFRRWCQRNRVVAPAPAVALVGLNVHNLRP